MKKFMDVEIAQRAIDAFVLETKLPTCSYLLSELKELQMEIECSSFQEIFSAIDPSASIRDIAKSLAKCIRLKEPFTPELYLEAEQMFRDIEARIRFSIFPVSG